MSFFSELKIRSILKFLLHFSQSLFFEFDISKNCYYLHLFIQTISKHTIASNLNLLIINSLSIHQSYSPNLAASLISARGTLPCYKHPVPFFVHAQGTYQSSKYCTRLKVVRCWLYAVSHGDQT